MPYLDMVVQAAAAAIVSGFILGVMLWLHDTLR